MHYLMQHSETLVQLQLKAIDLRSKFNISYECKNQLLVPYPPNKNGPES